MKITKLETLRASRYPNLCYLLVHTDEGITGLGETFFGPGEVEAYLHETAAPRLLGADPLQIERIAQVLRPYAGATSTGVEVRGNSAVDIALWDILGQLCSQPLYQLVGGASRESVPIYNTCAGPKYMRAPSGQAVSNWGLPGDEPTGRYEDLEGFLRHPGELARELLASNVTAMKIWPFDPYAERSGGQRIEKSQLKQALWPFAQIRDAVGDAMGIMVELHGLWAAAPAAQILRALEEFAPLWAEDPLQPGAQLATLERLASGTSTPLALSETLAGQAGYLSLLERGLVGVALADASWCGGITTARKIASAAEGYLTPFSLHDCTGPVNLVVSAHLSLSLPNAFLQETVRAHYHLWYGDIVTQLPPIVEGRIRPPEGAGLGTQLRPELLGLQGGTTRTSSI